MGSFSTVWDAGYWGFGTSYFGGMTVRPDDNLLYIVGNLYPDNIDPDYYLSTYDGSTFTILENLTTAGMLIPQYPIAYDGLIIIANGSAKEIWSYDPDTSAFVVEHTLVTGNVNQFFEYNGQLLAITSATAGSGNDQLLGRNSGGTWTGLASGMNTNALSILGTYKNNLLVSYTVVGSPPADREYGILMWDGVSFSTQIFSELEDENYPAGTTWTNHYQITAMQEFGDNLFVCCGPYLHKWDGTTLTEIQLLTSGDGYQWNNPRSLAIFDGQLAWGRKGYTDASPAPGDHPNFIYLYDEDGTPTGALSGNLLDSYAISDITVYKNKLYCFGTSTGQGNYVPPASALIDGNVLYVYSDSETPVTPSNANVKILGLAESKAGDSKLYATIWKPNAIYLREFNSTTLAVVRETYLGSATEEELDNYVKVAYPYTDDLFAAGTCLVHGYMAYGGGTQILYVTSSSVIVTENSWGNDDVGAFTSLNGVFYCVRNKAGTGQLYRGTLTNMQLTAIIDFPVHVNTLKFDASGTYMFAGNRVADNVPRIMVAQKPFNTWVDVTLNYPSTGQVTSVVPL